MFCFNYISLTSFLLHSLNWQKFFFYLPWPHSQNHTDERKRERERQNRLSFSQNEIFLFERIFLSFKFYVESNSSVLSYSNKTEILQQSQSNLTHSIHETRGEALQEDFH